MMVGSTSRLVDAAHDPETAALVSGEGGTRVVAAVRGRGCARVRPRLCAVPVRSARAWAARADEGFYLGCADIAITDDGLLPNYAELPTESGELP